MPTESWGLLGPEYLPSSRRARSLGLGRCIRRFNDRAVPGLGGVWFAKQLVLPTLSIDVASAVRARGVHVSNIEAANAIEAIACRLAYINCNWSPDARLRGRLKLRSRDDLRFSKARQSGFYVSQPMRQAAVQALPALGLVEPGTRRFNSYAVSDSGRELAKRASCGFRPSNRDVVTLLQRWVAGETDRIDFRPMREMLSPACLLSDDARTLIRELLLRGARGEHPEDCKRRQDALSWVDTCAETGNRSIDWSDRPEQIRSTSHWQDIHCGALFTLARDGAIRVLDAIESHMGASNLTSIGLEETAGEAVLTRLAALRRASAAFVDAGHRDQEATEFCRDCQQPNDTKLIAMLVKRDDRVLRLRGNRICAGPAFEGKGVEAVAAVPAGEWPRGLSYRIPNLFYLSRDLNGELDQYVRELDTTDDES